jgi:predicted GNAT family N-acyltransferase
MPATIKKRFCWIWNVDEKDKPGTHWIAIVKEDRDIFFSTVLERRPNFSNVNIGRIIFAPAVGA